MQRVSGSVGFIVVLVIDKSSLKENLVTNSFCDIFRAIQIDQNFLIFLHRPVVFSLDGDSLYVADFVLATLMEQQISSQATQNGEGTSTDQPIAPRVR